MSNGNAAWGRQGLVNLVLSALLILCPGSGWAAASGESVAASGGLSVASDPPGASVYVDGRFVGATPVSFARLAAGDHRVRVVKSGYLENGRIVNVSAGRSNTLQVKLTPHGVGVEATTQVTGGGGGGSKKWLWIGLAGGGATASALYLTRNSPPIAGTVLATPSTGLAAVTVISFAVQGASDPDGDPLTFSWDFGDGTTATGATPTKVYGAAGTFTVTLTVSDGKKQVTAPASTVVVRNVNGTWISVNLAVTRIWVLTQSDTRVTGTYTSTSFPGLPGTVTATLRAQRAFSGTAALSGIVPFRFDGDFNEAITSLTGLANDSGFNNTSLTFTRQ